MNKKKALLFAGVAALGAAALAHHGKQKKNQQASQGNHTAGDPSAAHEKSRRHDLADICSSLTNMLKKHKW